MTRRETLLGALSAAGAPNAVKAAKPNIVLILADDQGYGDLTCYNPDSVIPTPHTDRIARNGVRFSDAHSGSAVCSPTRYGLLTGRYAWRSWLKFHVLKPYDPPLIEPGRTTLPGMLAGLGYRTACIGKWHLGWTWPRKGEDWDFTQPIADGPTTRGFQTYFGTDVPNYPPYCFIQDNRTVGLPTARKTTADLSGRPGPMLPGWRMDEILPALASRAVEYMRTQARSRQPFFLYLPLTSPHEPIAPSKRFAGRSGISPLADFMMETDAVVGQVLDELERSRLASNTILIYAADNGHASYTGLPDLMKRGHRASGPFRGYKGSIYEGGHRVPLLVQWPGRIQAGTASSQLVCLTDLMATIAEAVDTRLPPNAAEDSLSFLPVLERRAASGPARTAIVHHSVSGQFAIREKHWKLILPEMPDGSPPAAKPEVRQEELFDLLSDPGEREDVRAAHPEVAIRLRTLLDGYKASGRSVPA